MINLIKEITQALTVKQVEMVDKLTERLKCCDHQFTRQEITTAYLKCDYLDLFIEELIAQEDAAFEDIYNLFYFDSYKCLGSDYTISKE
jgi:hypothetical protein